MKNLKKRKEALKTALQNLKIEQISEIVWSMLDEKGKKREVRSDYDVREFGFSPNDFASLNNELFLCAGVGKHYCKDYGTIPETLFFLKEDNIKKGITFFGINRANDFQSMGLRLI